MAPKARIFQLIISVSRSKVTLQSDLEIKDFLRRLLKDSKKTVNAYLWLDPESSVRHRVEDESAHQVDPCSFIHPENLVKCKKVLGKLCMQFPIPCYRQKVSTTIRPKPPPVEIFPGLSSKKRC